MTTATVRRFTIRWRPSGEMGPGQYVVSIPGYEGGEVVAAEDHDALAEQARNDAGAIAQARAEFRDALDADEGAERLRDLMRDFLAATGG